MKMNGQASIEYIILLALAIVIFLVVMTVINEQLQIIGAQRTTDSARLALKQISDAATDVYQQGRGAIKVVTITFPDGIDTGSPQIVNNTVLLTVKGSYISYKLDFPFSGTLPPRGTVSLVFTSMGGSVVAGPLPFLINPTSLAFSACRETFVQHKTTVVTFVNNQNVSTPLSFTVLWTNGTVNLSYLPLSLNLSIEGSDNISVDVAIAANVTGFFNGQIIVTTSAGSNYSAPIPVTVDVTSCTGNATQAVSNLGVTTYKNSSYTTTKTAFSPIDNVTLTGTNWQSSSSLTLDLRYPNGTSVSGYPTTMSTNATGGFVYVFNPSGLISGNYTAVASQLSVNRSTVFTLRGCN